MFQVADQRGTGRVDREQFVAVMHALDRQQRLNLGDDYILRLFRDLDLDFCGTVDWQQFLAAFEAGEELGKGSCCGMQQAGPHTAIKR